MTSAKSAAARKPPVDIEHGWMFRSYRCLSRTEFRATPRRLVVAVICTVLALSSLLFAHHAHAQFATGGQGVYRDNIVWMNWGAAGTQLPLTTTITSVTPVAGQFLRIACDFQNTANRAVIVFNPSGRGLSALYNIGGVSSNSLVGLAARDFGVTAAFNLSCTATFGPTGTAADPPFVIDGLVFADAEQHSGNTEWVGGRPIFGDSPVISASQVARCEHFVKLAVEHGGRVATGGKRPAHLDGGYFFEPTVLDLPDNADPAAQEEIFGPVVGIIGYRDLDHAVEMANDSKYGLSGYVHGKDSNEALALAKRIDSGAIHVNGALSSTYVPFGGIKLSGIGHERGVEGMRMFQRLKIFSVTE